MHWIGTLLPSILADCLLSFPPAGQGEWVENKMHGHGVFTDASGHKWEGDFHNGSGPGLTCDLR